MILVNEDVAHCIKYNILFIKLSFYACRSTNVNLCGAAVAPYEVVSTHVAQEEDALDLHCSTSLASMCLSLLT